MEKRSMVRASLGYDIAVCTEFWQSRFSCGGKGCATCFGAQRTWQPAGAPQTAHTPNPPPLTGQVWAPIKTTLRLPSHPPAYSGAEGKSCCRKPHGEAPRLT